MSKIVATFGEDGQKRYEVRSFKSRYGGNSWIHNIVEVSDDGNEELIVQIDGGCVYNYEEEQE